MTRRPWLLCVVLVILPMALGASLVRAGERLAVQSQYLADARQLYARRKILQHLLTLARLQAEERLSARLTRFEDPVPRVVPAVQVVNANALQHGRRALQERHRGRGRTHRQLLRWKLEAQNGVSFIWRLGYPA